MTIDFMNTVLASQIDDIKTLLAIIAAISAVNLIANMIKAVKT